MKRLAVTFILVLAATLAFGKALLPSQVYRRGLTNEQIGDILKRHPDATLRISAADWRAVQYQLHRFDNMTNYIEIVADKAGEAKLVLDLTDTAEQLTASNGTLRVTCEKLVADVAAETARADEAEADANVTREIRKAAKRTEKNIEKVKKTIEQAKKKAADEAEAALWTALLAILNGEDPN